MRQALLVAVFAAVWEDPDLKWQQHSGEMGGERNRQVLIIYLELVDPVFLEALFPLDLAVT